LSVVLLSLVVPLLYREPAFEAFDDFSDFVESISCEPSKICQVPVVRIHAGEPPLGINNLQERSPSLCTNFVPTPPSCAAELIDAVIKAR